MILLKWLDDQLDGGSNVRRLSKPSLDFHAKELDNASVRSGELNGQLFVVEPGHECGLIG
jgi:hypothetical protein